MGGVAGRWGGIDEVCVLWIWGRDAGRLERRGEGRCGEGDGGVVRRGEGARYVRELGEQVELQRVSSLVADAAASCSAGRRELEEGLFAAGMLGENSNIGEMRCLPVEWQYSLASWLSHGVHVRVREQKAGIKERRVLRQHDQNERCGKAMPKSRRRGQLYNTEEQRSGRSVQGSIPRLSERLGLRLARPPLITLSWFRSNWFAVGIALGRRRRDVSQPASLLRFDGDKAGA